MPKTYFHNSKPFFENEDKKKFSQTPSVEIKNVVDINILLNRVKIEKKKETKRKIIFFSFITLVLGLFGALIINI